MVLVLGPFSGPKVIHTFPVTHGLPPCCVIHNNTHTHTRTHYVLTAINVTHASDSQAHRALSCYRPHTVIWVSHAKQATTHASQSTIPNRSWL